MTININPLDPDSIDAAIKEIERYMESVEAKAKRFVEELTDKGTVKAKELVPVRTGEAQQSIFGYVNEDCGFIRAGGYCAYIEFGTGVRGENGSSIISEAHPNKEWLAMFNWLYGSGATIFTTKDGKRGWYYPADDGTWKFTTGMPSRPFMFETSKYLKEIAPEIAKEVFGNGQG